LPSVALAEEKGGGSQESNLEDRGPPRPGMNRRDCAGKGFQPEADPPEEKTTNGRKKTGTHHLLNFVEGPDYPVRCAM